MVKTAGNNGVKGLGAGSKARRSRPKRRTVTCDGVPGVLVKGADGWALDNEPEVRMLAAMGGSDQALGRLRALAETLNAGLIDPSGLSLLNKRLAAIAAVDDEDDLCRVRVPDEVVPAAAFACAHLGDENSSEWLVWMLSARLDDNLLRNVLPGPGLLTFQYLNSKYDQGFDRDARWADQMPPSFWEALSSHPDRWLADAAAASDPGTKAKELKRLAQSDDDVVLDLVASHPNTPSKTLVGISETPDVSYFVRWRVAQNKSASARTLRRLAGHAFWQIRFVAASHPNMDAATLAGLGGDETEQVRSAVGRHLDTPVDVLRELAGDDDKSVRASVASNPSSPVELIERLLSDRISSVRRNAVYNPSTPVELVIPRAQDRAQGVRRAVAADSRVPAHVFESLARDPKLVIRRTVAYTENAPGFVLRDLAADPDEHVKYWVAGNPSTPPDVLTDLSAASDAHLRALVAGNPSAPAGVLKTLAEDPSESVRSGLAGNSSASADVLRALAASAHFWVRADVAGNPSAPAGVLRTLADDPEYWVRARVAANPSASTEALAVLAGDANYRISADAAANLKKRQEPAKNQTEITADDGGCHTPSS